MRIRRLSSDNMRKFYRRYFVKGFSYGTDIAGEKTSGDEDDADNEQNKKLHHIGDTHRPEST